MFDKLSDKLQVALGDLRRPRGAPGHVLSASNAQDPMALLHSDVDFKDVKEFVAKLASSGAPSI
jgi:signal recognition particle GTPase